MSKFAILNLSCLLESVVLWRHLVAIKRQGDIRLTFVAVNIQFGFGFFSFSYFFLGHQVHHENNVIFPKSAFCLRRRSLELLMGRLPAAAVSQLHLH